MDELDPENCWTLIFRILKYSLSGSLLVNTYFNYFLWINFFRDNCLTKVKLIFPRRFHKWLNSYNVQLYRYNFGSGILDKYPFSLKDFSIEFFFFDHEILR